MSMQITGSTHAQDPRGPAAESASGTPTAEPPIGLPRFQLAVVLLMFLAGALLYSSLPERIPVHWNVYNRVDRWETKSLISVFQMPLATLGMALLFWGLPRLDPLKRSYARFRSAYYVIVDVTVALMAFLYGVILYASFGAPVRVDVLAPLGIALLFAVMGNQMAKVKRNFFVGIRTPWTLASEKVWVRTHRVGARVFVAAGLVSAFAAFLPAPANFVVFIGILIGAAIAVSAYSYFIYRRLERAGLLTDSIRGPEPL